MTSDPARPPVLDVDLLDAAAEAALGDVRVDLGAVRARAVEATAARRRRYVALAAAAAVVALLAGVALSGLGVLRSAPQPAQVPSGPGALPERLYPAPTVLRSVSDAPIGRVAVVLLDEVRTAGWSPLTSTEPVLVSADGGEYRRLPGALAGRVSLSADGRVVAWATRSPTSDLVYDAPVRWVDVRTGRVGSAGFDYPADQEPGVESTSLSPDGRTLLVGTSHLVDPADEGLRSLDAWTVDTTTGRATPLCRRCSVVGGWDAQGRLLVEPGDGVPTDPLPGRGVLPTADGVGSSTSLTVATPPVLVSNDGRRRLVMTKTNPSTVGEMDSYRLVELSAPAPGAPATTPASTVVDETDLGRAVDGNLLAWSWRTDDALVWLAGDGYRQTVREVSLVTGPGRTLLDVTTRKNGYPAVQLVAADVFAGGRTAATPRPGSDWLSGDGLRLLASRWYRWLVAPVVVGLLLWLPPRIRRRRGAVVPAGPSRLDRAADAAAKDFFGGPFDRRAHPGRPGERTGDREAGLTGARDDGAGRADGDAGRDAEGDR